MNETENATAILARYAEAIDREILAELDSDLDTWLSNAIKYHFGWLDTNFQPVNGGNGGKKLRPVMALLAYQGALEILQPGLAATTSLEQALPLAAAIEMIHNFSLIHDDIEDSDRERRGRATLWTLFGQPKAINIGDCLQNLAYRRLLRGLERGLSAAQVAQQAALAADTCVKLTVGQHIDMSFEDNLDVTPKMYLKMIEGKTGVLISFSTYGGALAALRPDVPEQAAKLELFRQFGLQIGLGFQIRDDILGIWGLTADTGKPSGSDIRRRKKSLPVIYALANSTGTQHERLLEIYRSSTPVTPEQEQFVMATLAETGAREYSQAQADERKTLALTALTQAAGGADALSNNRPLRHLQELCTFLVERNY